MNKDIEYYLYHIFYYIFYRKYRILISNVWVESEREKDGRLPIISSDWIHYRSLNGRYNIEWFQKISYFSIRSNGDKIEFFIDDGINGEVCSFFIKNHKDKFVKLEDKVMVQRNYKLEELGI